MMQNWKKYSLGELSKSITYGYTESASLKEIGPKFLRITDIQNSFISWDIVPYCIISDKNLKKYQLEIGDIIIARTGNSTGANAIIKDEINAVYASYLIRYQLNEKIVYPFYVAYCLKSKKWFDFVDAIKGGSAQPGANAQQFAQFPINLPPLTEQRAIASILSAVDDKIELNLQMNKTLEEMAMALYKHWFVDFGPFKDDEFVESELGMIPKGWEVKRLGDVSEFSNGFAFKSTDLLKEEQEDCFHVFKMGHILKGGGLKSDGTKSWIKKDKCIKLDKYVLKIGDILMSMTDMKDNMTILGHTALMNENIKFIVNQRVGLIRAKNNIGIDYPFIYITTNHKDYIEKLRSQANSGVQVNLSTDAIKNSKILAPFLQLNLEFDAQVKPLFEKINQNSLENQVLKDKRDTLLPKLISGEIRVKHLEVLQNV